MDKCQAVSQSNASNLMDTNVTIMQTCIIVTARKNARKKADRYTHFLATSICSTHFKDLHICLTVQINNWTAWRCSSIPIQYSRSGATLNNKYDNVCTTPVPYDMNIIYQKNVQSGHPHRRDARPCYIFHYSQTAKHFSFVRRSGGTVTEDKLHVLSISQSESGPSWWSQI